MRINSYNPISNESKENIEDTLHSALSKYKGFFLPKEKSTLALLLLCLTAMCKLISCEEILYHFPMDNVRVAQSIRTRLSQMSKQRRLMVGVTLYQKSENDSITSTAYGLTQEGYKMVLPFFSKLPSFNFYKLGSSSLGNAHIYSNGWALMSFLSSPFTECLSRYEPEKRYKSNTNFKYDNTKNDNELIIDSLYHITTNKGTEGVTVYLEQDMGTERLNQLRYKFMKYAEDSSLDLTSGRTVICLSERMPKLSIAPYRRINAGNIRFSQSTLKKVLSYCEAFSCPLSEVYDELSKNSSPSSIEGTFLSLWDNLKLTGFVNEYTSYAELQDYYENLLLCKNIYYNYEINSMQETFCNNKRRALLKDYSCIHLVDGNKEDVPVTFKDGTVHVKYLRELGDNLPKDVVAMLDGMHLYITSTNLLNTQWAFITYCISPLRTTIENTLKHYIPGFDATTYVEKMTIPNTHPLYRKGSAPFGRALSLCNSYLSNNKEDGRTWYVSVEDLSHDISSGVRLYTAFRSLVAANKSEGVIYVLLVKDMNEAIMFDRLFECYLLPLKCALKCYYLETEKFYAYNYLNRQWGCLDEFYNTFREQQYRNISGNKDKELPILYRFYDNVRSDAPNDITRRYAEPISVERIKDQI